MQSTPLSQHENEGQHGARRSDFTLWADYLPQAEASAFLKQVCGCTFAPKTLQKRRVIGGGPPFLRVMSRIVYPRDQLKAWAEAQRSPIVNSTSELPQRAA